MREPQPSHMGRSGEGLMAHLSAPRLKRQGERPHVLCHPRPRRNPWHSQGHASGKDLLLLPPLGQEFCLFAFLILFLYHFGCPKGHPSKRSLYLSPMSEVGHIFASQKSVRELVLPLSCFANGCVGPHLLYHHPQSCKKTEFRVSQPPPSFLQSHCWRLGELSAWLLMALGCCCDSTVLSGNFSCNALYFTPEGDNLKLLGCLGAKRYLAESSHTLGAVS